jgi:ribosomal protein S18 acetylase RimI-like enzyme
LASITSPFVVCCLNRAYATRTVAGDALDLDRADARKRTFAPARPSGWLRDHARLTRQRPTIRAAQPADVPEVLALWSLARSRHAVTPDREADVRRLISQTPGSLLVAELDGRVIGALIAAWDGWRGNMYRLAVEPGRRRLGLARALVEAGERRLRGLGARRITALVAHDDEVAGAFWDALGYPVDTMIGRRVRNLGGPGAGESE